MLGLAERLGFGIRDATLYDRALTHSSRQSEGEQAGYDYESLEFWATPCLAWQSPSSLSACPISAGDYSRMRAGLVNRKTVAG